MYFIDSRTSLRRYTYCLTPSSATCVLPVKIPPTLLIAGRANKLKVFEPRFTKCVRGPESIALIHTSFMTPNTLL